MKNKLAHHVTLLVYCMYATAVVAVAAPNGNRYTYLTDQNPYYVHQNFPRLSTPQWVGEEGVDAVIILSIDDMRNPATYENYLRPILNRLHEIENRAPVSIFTNSVDPQDPQLQSWIKEGLSLEVHTIDHPCPCLNGGDFAQAKSTYDRCVDLMASIPNSQAVAFRMPCCDSLNTPSPRFWYEIFAKTTAAGNHLAIDSSVFNVFTSNDPELANEITTRDDGDSRFHHYIPFDSFVNTIENYPYPFVQAGVCWQFPCVVPSDWEAQNIQRSNNPDTVRDMKFALDATVIKKGVYPLVFHPHGWIRNDQIVELINHAHAKYGKRVKFLTFKDCLERINQHLLKGSSLRAANGNDNGVRLLDINDDGYMDVVLGNGEQQLTRIYVPATNTWKETRLPARLAHSHAQFFSAEKGKETGLWVNDDNISGVWMNRKGHWVEAKERITIHSDWKTSQGGVDQGLRFRDVDNDGSSELLTNDGKIYQWINGSWEAKPFELPSGMHFVTETGADNGLRFVDVNEDGYADLLQSNSQGYNLNLYDPAKSGWAIVALAGKRPEDTAVPMIALGGTNSGAWFSRKHLWVQNEFTQNLPALVDRRSFVQLLANIPPLPKPPEDSLKSIQTIPGFKVELVAAEPLVMDPVAFDWGTDGRLWVVEMADYPLGLDNKGKPGGRVKYLEDTNNDGKYDKATLFVDHLGFPSDVMTWRDGVLVTAAPNIWYFEDSNNDGQADIKKVLFDGFAEGNQQHRVNGLRWGLDNWIYLANGDSDGVVHSLKTGDHINIAGRDLKLRPDTGDMIALAGKTQHGRNRDDWGNWWGANNSNPMFQYILTDHYHARNPHVAPTGSRHAVASLQNSPLYPISRIMSHWEGYRPPAPGQPSRFTSACSTMMYRDDLLGSELRASMLVSEPVHNLIHRRHIRMDGLLMHSSKPESEDGTEFLRSTDSWFRPTTIRTGPDGAIYFADIYRIVIEHPEWINDQTEMKLDLREGADKGRIYRVVREDTPLRPYSFPAPSDSDQFVRDLTNKNGWVRDYAHRQLVWSEKSPTIDRALETITLGDKSPVARLHALSALSGRGVLSAPVLLKSLQDQHPEVKRLAVRLSESFSDGEDAPVVSKSLNHLSKTEHTPQVLLQLAYSLGEFHTPEVALSLANILHRQGENHYIVSAALSSTATNSTDVLRHYQKLATDTPSATVLEALLTTTLAANDQRSISKLAQQLLSPAAGAPQTWHFTALNSVQRLLKQRGTTLANILRTPAQQETLQQFSSRAQLLFENNDQPTETRVAALEFLLNNRTQVGVSRLIPLLKTQTPRELQVVAINFINTHASPELTKSLIEDWSSIGPVVSDRLITMLIQHTSATRELLSAIESKKLKPNDFNASHRQTLLDHPNEQLRQQAQNVFGTTSNAQRQQLIKQYLTVTLKADGDITHGKELFIKTCSACHRLNNHGVAVGPNLHGLKNKSSEFLTTHILDPNKAVEDKFRNYSVLTVRGTIITGLITEETAISLTITAAKGDATTILRKDIQENGLRRTGQSMMPVGLEKFLSQDDMSDVIAFIQANQTPPKSFEGNMPTTVKLRNGKYSLPASQAAIYGTTAVFEAQYGNIGFWGSKNDRVVWTINIEKAGEFDVILDWAAPENTAGNQFELTSGESSFVGVIAATDSWDDYQQRPIGTLTLPAGDVQLTFSSTGSLNGFLLDLRTITLVPSK
ncbi:MAG: PVC-type heme-binding CxxCH protein [Planctomycetota bacterium]|nr:PVC-type heme-binding CxxCH protein [Planctomycetota bacterium]